MLYHKHLLDAQTNLTIKITNHEEHDFVSKSNDFPNSQEAVLAQNTTWDELSHLSLTEIHLNHTDLVYVKK